MKLLSSLITLAAITLYSSPTFANSSHQAQRLMQASKKANHTVQKVLQSASAQASFESLEEADDRALPALMKAGEYLAKAAETAELAVIAYDSANVAKGNYHYSIACSQTGIARSSIGRANLAASTPPYGCVSAFGQELTDLLEEYTAARLEAGCP